MDGDREGWLLQTEASEGRLISQHEGCCAGKGRAPVVLNLVFLTWDPPVCSPVGGAKHTPGDRDVHRARGLGLSLRFQAADLTGAENYLNMNPGRWLPGGRASGFLSRHAEGNSSRMLELLRHAMARFQGT